MKIKLLFENAKVPTYATDGSAAFDFYATNAVTISPGNSGLTGTGIAVEIPKNHVILVFSRSGHGFNHGLRLSNCVGVIDEDFRGEIMVRLHNDSNTDYTVNAGERVAQGLVLATWRHKLEVVDSLSETKRGTNGLGSTGK